jgi:hypothetical protein
MALDPAGDGAGARREGRPAVPLPAALDGGPWRAGPGRVRPGAGPVPGPPAAARARGPATGRRAPIGAADRGSTGQPARAIRRGAAVPGPTGRDSTPSRGNIRTPSPPPCSSGPRKCSATFRCADGAVVGRVGASARIFARPAGQLQAGPGRKYDFHGADRVLAMPSCVGSPYTRRGRSAGCRLARRCPPLPRPPTRLPSPLDRSTHKGGLTTSPIPAAGRRGCLTTAALLGCVMTRPLASPTRPLPRGWTHDGRQVGCACASASRWHGGPAPGARPSDDDPAASAPGKCAPVELQLHDPGAARRRPGPGLGPAVTALWRPAPWPLAVGRGWSEGSVAWRTFFGSVR